MKPFGVDVSKKELVCFDGLRVSRFANTKSGIAKLLKGLSEQAVVAMESTGGYHLALADAAFEQGLTVFVLNPKDVKRYRDAVASRAKTDPLDAEVIARFAERERESLRPYKPAPMELRRVRTLILRRKTVAGARSRLRQSLSGVKGFEGELKALIIRLDKLLARIDAIILSLLSPLEEYRHLQAVPGLGPLSSAALLSEMQKGDFASADAFVAFLGLDLVANDSGQKKGRRHLSKLGNSETRRLSFIAAMSASRTKVWRPIYLGYASRMSRIQALVALTRRIVRTAWSISRYKTEFDPKRISLGVDKKP